MDAASEEDTVFSSQPQSETETEKEGEDGRREYKMRGKAMPTLIETLGLIYLGMVLLRLPLSMGDIHRYATSLSTLLRPHVDPMSAGQFKKISPSSEPYASSQRL